MRIKGSANLTLIIQYDVIMNVCRAMRSSSLGQEVGAVLGFAGM